MNYLRKEYKKKSFNELINILEELEEYKEKVKDSYLERELSKISYIKDILEEGLEYILYTNEYLIGFIENNIISEGYNE